MATPTYEELLTGATTWRRTHMGVTYILSHHGYRSGDERPGCEPHPGTWCYYIVIPEQMYPHRWEDFAATRGEHGFENHGSAFDHDMFDTEITWASSEPYFDRNEKRLFDAAKVGCDYGHSHQRDMGYPDTFASVTSDAKRTIEKFLIVHPDRKLSSGYSGRWGNPGDFYTAINGALVHKDDRVPADWLAWQPAQHPTDAADADGRG